LLAEGLLERCPQPNGGHSLQLSLAGCQYVAEYSARNRRALGAHEALVQRVADAEVALGRIAWCGLTLLGKPSEQWLHLKPDVFSIRNTTVEDYLEPLAFEIKVSRADLLGDLRKPDKRAGYRAVAGGVSYVLSAGIGGLADIPEDYGVIIANAERLETLRLPQRQPVKLAFHHWMSLAKATRHRAEYEADARL